MKADMIPKNSGHNFYVDSESIGKVAQKFTRNKLSTKKLWQNGVFNFYYCVTKTGQIVVPYCTQAAITGASYQMLSYFSSRVTRLCLDMFH
jgi:hypothetical protein